MKKLLFLIPGLLVGIALVHAVGTVDTEAPVISSFQLNGGNSQTDSTTVTLGVTATDNVRVVGMDIWNSLSTNCSNTSDVINKVTGVPYSSTYSWSIGNGNGTKNVCLQVFDGAVDSSGTFIPNYSAPSVSSISVTLPYFVSGINPTSISSNSSSNQISINGSNFDSSKTYTVSINGGNSVTASFVNTTLLNVSLIGTEVATLAESMPGTVQLSLSDGSRTVSNQSMKLVVSQEIVGTTANQQKSQIIFNKLIAAGIISEAPSPSKSCKKEGKTYVVVTNTEGTCYQIGGVKKTITGYESFIVGNCKTSNSDNGPIGIKNGETDIGVISDKLYDPEGCF